MEILRAEQVSCSYQTKYQKVDAVRDEGRKDGAGAMNVKNLTGAEV